MSTTANTESHSSARCLKLHADDNVLVALEYVAPGPLTVIGLEHTKNIAAVEAVAAGHKIASRSLMTGDVVRKYGVPIGFATAPIAVGAWVHTHNCRSGLDERSHTLDPHTGAPTDTLYA